MRDLGFRDCGVIFNFASDHSATKPCHIIQDNSVRYNNFLSSPTKLWILFSKACKYGIRATLYLAQRSESDEWINIKDISKAIGSPEAFTGKIMQAMVRHKVVSSLKGPTGGFKVQKNELNHIKLGQVVMAIDGDSLFKGCALGLDECSESMPCPVHDQFKHIRFNLTEMLDSTKLEGMSDGLKDGLTFLRV